MKEFVRGVLAEAARHDGPPQEPTPRRMEGEGKREGGEGGGAGTGGVPNTRTHRGADAQVRLYRYFSPVETCCRSCGAALKTLFNTFDDLVFSRLRNRVERVMFFGGVVVVVGSSATLPRSNKRTAPPARADVPPCLDAQCVEFFAAHPFENVETKQSFAPLHLGERWQAPAGHQRATFSTIYKCFPSRGSCFYK